MKIPTRTPTGEPNGYVILGWNVNEQPNEQPAQIYYTAIAPHSVKGPHLHMVRCGRFQCIVGNVKIVTRDQSGRYETHYSGVDHDYSVIKVEPGTAAALYNDGDTEVIVANMPSPAWRADAQDEWPVEGWDYL